MQVSLISFTYIVLSRIAGSYASSIFNFLRNFLIVFHSDCTNLQSYQQFRRVSSSPHLPQHLSLIFLMLTILTEVGLYLTVIWICISLMLTDDEHLFMDLSAICLHKLSIQFLCSFFEVSYHCIVVYFSLQICYLLNIFSCCDIECLYIHDCCIFLMN